MNLSHTNLSQFALPSVLVLLLVGMYSNTFLDRDLSTARPKQREVNVPPIVSSPGLSGVHARLWDDPLAVCHMHYEQQQKANSGKTVPPHVAIDGRIVQQELIVTIRNLVCHAKQDGKPINTLFLPVMLPGGPWGEHHEHRIRIRYAVKAALAESGFSTSFPDRMSYVVIQDQPTMFRVNTQNKQDMIVPFRLYQFQKDSPPPGISAPPTIRGKHFQIAVLWVNEQQLGRSPINGIDNIIRSITTINADFLNHVSINGCPDKDLTDRFHIRIIGPSSSDMLHSIENEIAPGIKAKNGCQTSPIKADITQLDTDVSIFNCRATKYSDCSPIPKKYSGITMVHVAGKDFKLNEKIIEEIDKRYGLDKDKKEIAIISEHDTRYGRAILDSFDKQLAIHFKRKHGSTNCVAPNDNIAGTLHFNYLRGIDGRGAFALKQESSSDQDEFQFNPLDTNQYTTLLSNIATNGRAKRFPEGESQFDYLERMREQLVAQNRRQKIKAIGVLGTDVYDKLLILRALRPRFPEALFFTTDLDAAMLHPDERATTRNLLIASHYDLALNDKLQCSTPPFRDSYQTSTFLGTKLAVMNQKSVEGLLKSKNGTKKTIAESCSSRTESPGERVSNAPSLFQVNRWGVQKVGAGNGVTKLHKESPVASKGSWLLSIALSIIALAVYLGFVGSRMNTLKQAGKANSFYLYFMVLLSVTATYLFLFLLVNIITHFNPGGYMRMVSGVDHTVTVLVGISLVLLACYYLLFEVFRQYEINFATMPQICCDLYSCVNMSKMFLRGAVDNKYKKRWENCVITSMICSLLFVILAMLIKFTWGFSVFPHAHMAIRGWHVPHTLVSLICIVLFFCVPLFLVVYAYLLFVTEVRTTRECFRRIAILFPVDKYGLAYKHLPFAFAIDQVRGIAIQSKILHKRTPWLVVFLVLFSLMFHPELTPAREPMPLLLMVFTGSLCVLFYDYKVRSEAYKARKMVVEYIYGIRHKNGLLIASDINLQSKYEGGADENVDSGDEEPCPSFKSDPLGYFMHIYNKCIVWLKTWYDRCMGYLHIDVTEANDKMVTSTQVEDYTDGVHGSIAGIDDCHKAIEAAIKIIESEKRGAFQPWLETPLAQSIMWSAIVLICLDWLLRASAMWI